MNAKKPTKLFELKVRHEKDNYTTKMLGNR